MQELVIISGKGGTGKTSVAASLAVLGQPVVVADCDVDAADLHLVLDPAVRHSETFRSGYEAHIATAHCNGCGVCAQVCRFDAIRQAETDGGRPAYAIDPYACEGCGVCVRHCPSSAIDFDERECGEWFVSQTRCGPMIHARLHPAGENSGKLVSLVREQARTAAKQAGLDLVLIDGSPGIGCPVLASVTGATAALLVSEPTVSGLHDLERVAAATAHFNVRTMVCVNKWDVHPEMTIRIEALARGRGLPVVGRIRYDRNATQAQLAEQALVEYADGGAAADIRALWQAVQAQLTGLGQEELWSAPSVDRATQER